MENAPGNKANDISESVKSLSETVGQVGQQQIEIMTSVMKSGIEMAEPITKSVVDLAGSMMQSVNQVLQGVSSAIAPKNRSEILQSKKSTACLIACGAFLFSMSKRLLLSALPFRL